MSTKQQRNAPWFTCWGDSKKIREALVKLGASKPLRGDFVDHGKYIIDFSGARANPK